MHPLEEQLLKRLISLSRDETRRMVIAFSGGPDSCALLALSSALRSRLPHSEIYALHVNHKLRSKDELAAEHALLRELCGGFDVPLRIESVQEGAIADEAAASRCGIEAAARTLRYRLFEQYLKEIDSRICLLAHTRDDQVETAIQRFFEGGASDVMSGIPERRGPYFRPLLGIEKGELVTYLQRRSIPFSSDSSNNDTSLLRNKIRKELLPCLKAVFPAYKDGVLRFMEKQKMMQEAAQDLFHYPDLVNLEGNLLSWEGAPFFELPMEGRRRFLYYLYDRFPQNLGRVSYGLIKRIMELDKTGEEVVEAGGLRLFYDGRRIFWGPVVVLAGKNGYIRRIHNGVTLSLPGVGMVRFLWDGLEEPLIARSRLEGDIIRLKDGNRKRVKKIFQEWRVPPPKREQIPILEGREGVLAIFGTCCGYTDLLGLELVRRGRIKMEMLGEFRE
jgi:tRNA(Ile)-lysidine synthetase-like protein